MKLSSIQKFSLFFLLLMTAVFSFSCKTAGESSPTEAYKKLYNAVKAKDYAAIKALMTRQTIAFADGQSKSSSQTFEQMIANGFTATTFSSAMPEIRDERIKENMGAVEVWNSKESRWEDLPFINEDGWKLAVGDAFSGKFKSPGKGRAQLEAEANPDSNKMTVVPTNINSMPVMNANTANQNTKTK